MTALAVLLRQRIAATGPMTVADYMAECLWHPAHGYYSTRDPLGAAGDFTTAPEISQMFGELVGLCLAQAWLDQGSPAPFALVELGPGRGTLMADLWRATALVPGFHAAARMVLVESSRPLRAAQARALPMAAWVDSAAGLPDLPLFAIANEFFDALPIRQFLRTAEGWRERVVGLQDGALAFGLSPPLPCPDPRFASDPPGTLVETCAAARPVMQALAARMQARGVAIVIDYGGWRSRGDTLQALRAHAPEHPLQSPGRADLTAHVDFESLARAAALPHTGLTPQGDLLNALGIGARAERLTGGLTGAALQSHRAARHRLTHPSEMGSLFQAVAIHAPGTPPPPGFAP